MIRSENILNTEQLAGKAFSAQSIIFDDIYGADGMIQYKRKRVRAHMEAFLHKESHILELNAGTGEDALYFADHGHRVHATDISKGMLAQLAIKCAGKERIHFELCSYHALELLNEKGPYDHIFSNFAGLNCTGEIDKVLRSFSPLLKPGGMVTLVLLPRFCLWETLLLFKGKFKTAFRRFFAKQGADAFVEGLPFTCWYYNPSDIKKCLQNSFEVMQVEGLCTIVPPSYMEGFDKKYPKFFSLLCGGEELLKAKWLWRSIGDYYIITLKKKR